MRRQLSRPLLNSCDECGRPLLDPNAQYGWRCEQKLGKRPRRDQSFKAIDPALYFHSVQLADEFLARYKIDPSRVDLEKFYESLAGYIFYKSSPGGQRAEALPTPLEEAIRKRMITEIHEAFGYTPDELSSNIYTSNTDFSNITSVYLLNWLENEVSAYSHPKFDIKSILKDLPKEIDPNELLDRLQFVLDVGGLIPGYGEPLDCINAAIYALRGDWLNFGLSLASIIPVAGILGTAFKWAGRYGDDVYAMGRAMSKLDTAKYFDEFAAGVSINNLDDFFANPKAFGEATPEQYYRFFQENGYAPQALGSRSSLNGIPFDEGGGFRISWGGDKYLQYHPAISSHHGGAYWKLSSGATGTLRFDMNGNILP